MNKPSDAGSPQEDSNTGSRVLDSINVRVASTDGSQGQSASKSGAMSLSSASMSATGSLSSSYIMSFTVENQHTRFLSSLSLLNDSQIALMLQSDTLEFCRKLQESLSQHLLHPNSLASRSVLTATAANIIFTSIACVLEWQSKDEARYPAREDDTSSRKAALCQAFVGLATFCEERQIMVEQQHRKTYVQILKELAKLHARQGEAIQARQMLETAVLTESTFCPKTSEQKLSLATIRNDLALLCMELQDMDAALQHYQTALNLQREALQDEPGHPAIIMTLQSMAQLYIRCGMHDEALKTYHYILILLQQQDSSAKRTEMAATLSSMGLVYYALRDYSSALQHYKQVLTIQSHLQHDNDDTGVHRHFEIATTLNSIGMILCEVGSYDEARDTLQASLAKHLELFRAAKTLFLDHQNETSLHRHNGAISAVLYNLAVVYIQRGEDEIALQLFQKSIQFKKAVFGGRACPEMATNLQKLGGIHLERGEHKVAIVYLEEALQMLKQSVLSYQSADKRKDDGANVAPVETLYHQLIIVGNLHLASGNIPGMMSYMVEACRLMGNADAIQRTGLFTLGAYSMNRIHPRCAPAA